MKNVLIIGILSICLTANAYAFETMPGTIQLKARMELAKTSRMDEGFRVYSKIIEKNGISCELSTQANAIDEDKVIALYQSPFDQSRTLVRMDNIFYTIDEGFRIACVHVKSKNPASFSEVKSTLDDLIIFEGAQKQSSSGSDLIPDDEDSEDSGAASAL